MVGTFYTEMVLLSNNYIIVILILILCKIKGNVSEPGDKSYYRTREATASKFNNLLDSIANVNEQRLFALKHYTELDKYNLVSGILRHDDDLAKHSVLSTLQLNNNSPENDIVHEIFNDDDTVNSDQNIFQLSQEFHDNSLAGREINKQDLRNFIDTVNKENAKSESKESESDDDSSDGEEIIRTNGVTDKIKKKVKKETSTLIPTKIDNKEVLRIWKSCSKKAVKGCTKACKASMKKACGSRKCSKSMKKSFKKSCKSNCKKKFSEH